MMPSFEIIACSSKLFCYGQSVGDAILHGTFLSNCCCTITCGTTQIELINPNNLTQSSSPFHVLFISFKRREYGSPRVHHILSLQHQRSLGRCTLCPPTLICSLFSTLWEVHLVPSLFTSSPFSQTSWRCTLCPPPFPHNVEQQQAPARRACPPA